MDGIIESVESLDRQEKYAWGFEQQEPLSKTNHLIEISREPIIAKHSITARSAGSLSRNELDCIKHN